ncbi:alpha/beta hydrolase [Aureimonas sp. ME7]|uniref:RBBP9/YdeN family alpha/beta hydrolase n=1 Tax=Aureimonas sp. ME7 TaxID=2744252 RepID=UPI0015F5E069|nr:alpha/beta hydrolase [Aureimonas sp. ME7]
MRVSEVDILIVPGADGASEQHWQSRWEAKLPTASRVVPAGAGDAEAWSRSVADAVNAATRPSVIVAHALGVAAAVGAIPQLTKPVVGAFFVAPVDLSEPRAGFPAYSNDPLPFPSIVVASRNDPAGAFEAAEDIAASWGSLFIDAGESGGIDHQSGHGPWPEGLLTFGKFLSRLPAS